MIQQYNRMPLTHAQALVMLQLLKPLNITVTGSYYRRWPFLLFWSRTCLGHGSNCITLRLELSVSFMSDVWKLSYLWEFHVWCVKVELSVKVSCLMCETLSLQWEFHVSCVRQVICVSFMSHVWNLSSLQWEFHVWCVRLWVFCESFMSDVWDLSLLFEFHVWCVRQVSVVGFSFGFYAACMHYSMQNNFGWFHFAPNFSLLEK